jgi:predicted ATPase
MAVKVTISDLKSIKRLEFDIPMHGAFVVTGANGCGKTSLLTVLHRMGSSNAFQTGLPGGKTANGVDTINNTVVQYDVNGATVSYRYNQTRWSATPKSSSKLVRQAFSEVLFLKADSSRVEPMPNDMKSAKKMPASQALRDFMNKVFDTDKFNSLVQIKLQGRGTAHLIDISAPKDKKKTYYSEKAFSLGELCVMRLGLKLLSMKNGGLYIIDEFEMALHPAAQIRLFSEIERLAEKANCCALVSTHSSSLIKSAKRKNIIYLENRNGIVTIHRNVYPTYALQHLALGEENSPDRLIFVEDVAAKICIDEMLKRHMQECIDANIYTFASVQSVVIGGYLEVMRFLERSPALVPQMTTCIAVLDADAEPICMPPPGKNVGTAKLTVPQDLYQSLLGKVTFLPWTAEVGLCDLIRSDKLVHEKAIQGYVGCTNLTISQSAVNTHVGQTPSDARATCKNTIDQIAEVVAKKKTWSKDRAREALLGYLVKHYVDNNQVQAKKLFRRLFS